MPRVFTVYNCGTGFNRDRTDEIIANLATRTEGQLNVDWMINDGPGSAKPKQEIHLLQPSQLGVRHPVTQKRTSIGLVAKALGIATGFGWKHNVEYTMDVVKKLMLHPQPPSVINMAGWSRGAITCHMLAHALHSDPQTQHLELNIFAFDPVPGPGNFHQEQTSIPPNVHRYLAIVMEDEARGFFRPVRLNHFVDMPEDIKIKTYTMPGQHNTAVLPFQSAVGMIGRAMVEHFLTKHGTRLFNTLVISDLRYCELYAQVFLDLDRFRHLRGGNSIARTFQGGTKSRNLDNPQVAISSYFINSHHLHKFHKVFPRMRELLHRWMQGGGVDYIQLQQQAEDIRNRAPITYRSLAALGVF